MTYFVHVSCSNYNLFDHHLFLIRFGFCEIVARIEMKRNFELEEGLTEFCIRRTEHSKRYRRGFHV